MAKRSDEAEQQGSVKRARATPRHLRAQAYDPSSPFQPRTEAEPADTFLAPARRRKDKCSACASTNLSPVVLTAKQVKEAADKAAAHREQQLRAEFDAVLYEKLSSQWARLQEMNEASIHKQLAESQYSYMS